MDKDIEQRFDREAQYDEQMVPIMKQLADKAEELNLGLLVYCTFKREITDAGDQVAENSRDAAMTVNSMQLSSKVMYAMATQQLVDRHGIPDSPEAVLAMHQAIMRSITKQLTSVAEGTATY